MNKFRMRRSWAVLASVALAVGLSPLLLAGTASAATQATVHDDQEFFDAWTDTGITQIDLANSIDLTQYGDCGYYPERNSSGGAVLIDGHGFTLTQTCDANSVVYDDGSGEALTLQNITLTHKDSPTPSVFGNGVYNDGPITVLNSTITGNWAAGGTCSESVGAVCLNNVIGGGISSNSDVTVDGSTVSNNRALGLGGGISANGTVTVTNSHVDDNQVTDGGEFSISYGGGIFSSGGTTVTDSTVSSNTARCDTCEINLGGGGIASQGGDTTVTGSNVDGNFAVCEQACGNVGGGILTGGTLAVTGSSVSFNQASCATDCQADGGGIYAYPGFFIDSASNQTVHGTGRGAILTITDSTLDGNQAKTDDAYCDCSGGAILSDLMESVTVTRSTISGNVATWDGAASEAFTDGGAVTTGIRYENSTVTGNTSGFAGAIDAREDGVSLTLAYDTIDGNAMVTPDVSLTSSTSYPRFGSGGDGVRAAVPAPPAPQPANLSANELTTFGTVVADPIGGANCDIGGTTTSQGYNFSDDASCGFTNTAAGDQQNAGNPQLNPLAGNGGPTETMLPFTPKTNGAASPLIDAIPTAACQTGVASGVGTDQRGVTRPQLNGCDIGAVEVTGAEYQVEALVVTPRFTG